MQVLMLKSCSGPAGSFAANSKPIVDDATGGDMIRAGFAELLDADKQPVEPASEPTEPTEPKESKSKPRAKSK